VTTLLEVHKEDKNNPPPTTRPALKVVDCFIAVFRIRIKSVSSDPK
jgi:hypothetical protein